jgi:hypothetical protein
VRLPAPTVWLRAKDGAELTASLATGEQVAELKASRPAEPTAIVFRDEELGGFHALVIGPTGVYDRGRVAPAPAPKPAPEAPKKPALRARGESPAARRARLAEERAERQFAA